MNESSHSDNASQSARSARGKRGLDPKWYLDPGVFEFESKNIFQSSWFLVGYAKQVPEIGDYFCTKVRGYPVVVVRGESNRVRAFQNVCQHRGTQLCTQPRGHQRTAFACPYHGWKYDFAGDLIAAPQMQDVPGFRLEDFGIPKIELTDWHGLLLARVPDDQGETRPVELPFAKLDPLAGQYRLTEYQQIESIQYEIAANWKLIFQNFNECYHCPSVHPQLTPFSDYRDSENDFESGHLLGGPMKIRESAKTISREGILCGHVPEHLPDNERSLVRYYTAFPNLFVSFFPDYVMIHRLEPTKKNQTRIQCDFLFHPDTIRSEEFEPMRAVEFWDQTNRQDWEICERVQVGIATPGFQPSPYSNLESLLVAFDGFYKARMKELGYRR